MPSPPSRKARRNQGAGDATAAHILWNSGLLMACCEVVLANAQRFVPDMLGCVRRSVARSTTDLDFLRLDELTWQDIEAESIDYAIMEKADNLAVFPFSGRWSDLGDWQALRRELSAEGLAQIQQATFW